MCSHINYCLVLIDNSVRKLKARRKMSNRARPSVAEVTVCDLKVQPEWHLKDMFPPGGS